MNEEIKRLKDLIREACKVENVTFSDDKIHERIAEYLLKNGVCVSPCKVGDVGYLIMDALGKTDVIEIKVTDIANAFYAMHKGHEMFLSNTTKLYKSREEAEKALADKMAKKEGTADA